MWIDILGAALLHSTWQFTLIGLALYLMLQIIPARASQTRYLAGCVALTGCLFAFLATMVWAAPSSTAAIAAATAPATTLAGKLDPVALIVTAWLIGTAAILAHNALSLMSISRLRSSAQSNLSDDIKARFEHIASRMGVSRASFRLSDTIKVPCTFGTLKPIVLMPIELMSRLSADEIEAIVAHELAHIKRYDYLVNIIQQAVLSVLYYHPAVHFISREIDREREIACDDLASKITGHPRDLATALGKVTLFAHGPALAMSAKGRHLRCENDISSRMSRLMAPAREHTSNLVKITTTAIAAAGVLLFANLTMAHANGPAPQLTQAQSADLRDEICNQIKKDGYYRRSGFTKTGMVRVNLGADSITLNGEFVPNAKLPQYTKIIKKYGLKRGEGQYIYFNGRGSEIELGQDKTNLTKQPNS